MTEGSEPRERVVGIGGVFLAAQHPRALAEWYREHLGIELEAYDSVRYHVFRWRWGDESGRVGTTTWAVLPDAPDGPRRSAIGVNYHVRDLDRMLAQLRASGIEVEGPTDERYGRFAWCTDPEGNRVELYEESDAGG